VVAGDLAHHLGGGRGDPLTALVKVLELAADGEELVFGGAGHDLEVLGDLLELGAPLFSQPLQFGVRCGGVRRIAN